MTRIDHPTSLEDALRRLAEPEARPIAGGVAVLLRRRLGGSVADRYVAVGRLEILREITVEAATGAVIVGAAVTLAEVASSPVVQERVPGLAAAARAAASPAIRTIATLAGNVVDAPAGSDLVAAATALDASLDVRSVDGARQIVLRSFAHGPGPIFGPGELVVALRVPNATADGWSLQRLRTQGAGDRPAVTVAVQLRAAHGSVAVLQGAATFVGDRPMDLVELAGAAVGASVTDVVAGHHDARIEQAALTAVDRARDDGLALIDDGRGSAEYRRAVLAVLARRATVDAARSIVR